MVKDFNEQLSNAKHGYFAKQLSELLRAKKITISPIEVTRAINEHYGSAIARPHTVRKWLLGHTKPKSESMLLLANWLGVNPKDLILKSDDAYIASNRVSFEFDFTDQDVIAKYLSMTLKQKITVRLLIDAISDGKK